MPQLHAPRRLRRRHLLIIALFVAVGLVNSLAHLIHRTSRSQYHYVYVTYMYTPRHRLT